MGQGRQRGKRNHPLLHGKAKVVTGVLHISNVLCTSSFSSYFFCHQSVWLFPLLCYVNRLALYWVYLFLVRLCCRIQVKTLHVVGHLASETLPFDFDYMKIMYMNWGLRNEYESGLWINEHYLSSSENEAWKKNWFITSRVYYQPTKWPAPNWLVSSVGRALHRYRRGHRFKSRTGLNFFFRPYFYYCLSSVHYCQDRCHIHFTFCYRAFVCFAFSFPSVRRSSKQSPPFPPPSQKKKNMFESWLFYLPTVIWHLPLMSDLFMVLAWVSSIFLPEEIPTWNCFPKKVRVVLVCTRSIVPLVKIQCHAETSFVKTTFCLSVNTFVRLDSKVA